MLYVDYNFLSLIHSLRISSYIIVRVFFFFYIIKLAGQFSPALQDLRLPIVDNNICKRQYAKISGSNIDNKMLCAGFLAGGKDTCQVYKFICISKTNISRREHAQNFSGQLHLWNHSTTSTYTIVKSSFIKHEIRALKNIKRSWHKFAFRLVT